MDPLLFIRSLYLGDRACKAVILDGWNSTVRIQVDCISRVRSASGKWDYYTDEDISDGFLVFTEVQSFSLRNDGVLPNDSINSIDVVEKEGDVVTVELSIDAVAPDASHREALLRIQCKSLHLEDPSRPGVRINA